MKTLLAFVALIFTSLSSYAQSQCEWSFVTNHRCNGQNYIKGTASCRSGIYNGVFCHERNFKDGKACSEDVAPETMKCHQKLFSVQDPEVQTEPTKSKPVKRIPISPGWPKPEQTTQDANVDRCHWKHPGIAYYDCEGETFAFGDLSCGSRGDIPNVFCAASQLNNVDNCINDNNPKTQLCLKALTGLAPKKSRVADRCHWKEPGVAYYLCEGETFAFGHLSCANRGDIPNLFCAATHENNVDECINDNKPKTERCLSALFGLRARKPATPEATSPNEAIR